MIPIIDNFSFSCGLIDSLIIGDEIYNMPDLSGVHILADMAYQCSPPGIHSALFPLQVIWILALIVFIDSWCTLFWRMKAIQLKITNDVSKSNKTKVYNGPRDILFNEN